MSAILSSPAKRVKAPYLIIRASVLCGRQHGAEFPTRSPQEFYAFFEFEGRRGSQEMSDRTVSSMWPTAVGSRERRSSASL
jgi:hypothetical protein